MADVVNAKPVALLITRNFPPLVGGMENVNRRLLSELARDWQVALCGPHGSAAHAQEAMACREIAVKPLGMFLPRSLLAGLALARVHRPSLVLAGSGLAVPMAWLVARISSARLVVYLHGLDVIAPSWIYQTFWLPFIRRCDTVLVNSANTRRLAMERGVSASRIAILHPGTDMPELDPLTGFGFRQRFGLGAGSVLLSVGRFTRRKGLAEFVQRALPAIVAQDSGVVLAIIGDEASNALHGATGSERERILAAGVAAGVERNLRFLGRCDQPTLHAAYQAADCHVFPVLAIPGDVEGFGMVALESAAHGLMTVAFDVGGISDAMQEGVSGHLLPSGDYSGLARAVQVVIERSAEEKSVARLNSRAFSAGFEWSLFGRRLRELLAPVMREPEASRDGENQGQANE